MDTSLEAFKSSRETAKRHRELILNAFSDGALLSAEEIADRVPEVNYVMVGKRMSELERSGAVVRTNDLHVNRSGRKAVRYQAQ